MARKSIRIDAFGILDVKCKTCGKAMSVRPAQYAYIRYTNTKEKTGRKFFCKYTCMTAYDREQAEKKKKRKKEKRPM